MEWLVIHVKEAVRLLPLTKNPMPLTKLASSEARTAAAAAITALGNLRDIIRDAGPAEKAAIYDQLDLKVTFKPGKAKIRAEVTSTFAGFRDQAAAAAQAEVTARISSVVG